MKAITKLYVIVAIAAVLFGFFTVGLKVGKYLSLDNSNQEMVHTR